VGVAAGVGTENLDDFFECRASLSKQSQPRIFEEETDDQE
jgi:hypothetical protein